MKSKTFLNHRFTIDRPKGTVKKWPGGKTFTYPVDYGFHPRFKGEDGEGLDFFVGDDPRGHLESFQKLGPGRVLDETKYLVGVTDDERETIYRLYGPEIWHRKVYDNMDALMRDVVRRDSERDLYAVQAKEAGVMDSVRRFFSRGGPTHMPLQNVRPHADLVHPPVTVSRPAIVPPPPSPVQTTQPMAAHQLPAAAHAPTQRMPTPTQVGRTPPPLNPTQRVPARELPTPPGARTAPLGASQSGSFSIPGVSVTPSIPSVPHPFNEAARGPASYASPDSKSPRNPGLSANTAGLQTTGKTPVGRTSMSDMFMQAPGARESLKDLRVRAALGGRVGNDGTLVTSRPGTTNALAEHMMRHGGGEQMTPDRILQALRSPEYAAIRPSYKGASAKIAAWAHYGLKVADLKLAKIKRADIEKRLTGEVLVAGGSPSADLAPRFGTQVITPGEKTAAPDLLYKVAPSMGAAFDAFDAERKRQAFLDAQRDAMRYPASHYTQPAMMQYAMGGGDVTQMQAPTHHRRRHHHS